MQQGATAPLGMPADVLAYLRHLEKCENAKVEISGDQSAEVKVLMTKMQALGAGMGMMNPYDQSGDDKDVEPADYAKGKILDFRPRWQRLLDYFRSVRPPRECEQLAYDFDRATGEVPGMMGDLSDILNGQLDPAAALKKLEKFQNSSYSEIDRYYGRADEKLGQICQKYNTSKWFNIKTDVGGGSLLSKM
jgi:hypothetical protein